MTIDTETFFVCWKPGGEYRQGSGDGRAAKAAPLLLLKVMMLRDVSSWKIKNCTNAKEKKQQQQYSAPTRWERFGFRLAFSAPRDFTATTVKGETKRMGNPVLLFFAHLHTRRNIHPQEKRLLAHTLPTTDYVLIRLRWGL